MSIVLKGGSVLDGDELVKRDICMEDGKIVDSAFDPRIIDIKGLTVIPGLIDVHVHFRDFGEEHKEDWTSGSSAAAAGGITTVLDMPNNKSPVIDELSLELKRREVLKRSIVNFGLYVAVSQGNVDEINRLPYIRAVKLYQGTTTRGGGAGDLDYIFSHLRDVLIVVHAEADDIIEENAKAHMGKPMPHTLIRDSRAEYTAIMRILKLVERYHRRVHFAHVSAKESFKIIKNAKSLGLPVTCEVTPHHLYLDASVYGDLGNRAKMNPSLKYQDDRMAAFDAIHDGTVDLVATDHAPHTLEEKSKEYADAPSGVPGVETMLPLLLNSMNNGELTLSQVASLASRNPARIFGLKSKGSLDIGYDADMTVVDTMLSRKVSGQSLRTKAGWSPFEGSLLKGWPVMTIVGGNLVYDRGSIIQGHTGKEVF